jgi:hypothetical protein
MRIGVGFAVVLLLLATLAEARTMETYWPVARVMRTIDHVRVRVGERTVRIESDTTLCSGVGRRVKRRSIRMWNRFACTYTVFTNSSVDRDVEFRVHVLGPRRFVIRDAHWVAATR